MTITEKEMVWHERLSHDDLHIFFVRIFCAYITNWRFARLLAPHRNKVRKVTTTIIFGYIFLTELSSTPCYYTRCYIAKPVFFQQYNAVIQIAHLRLEFVSISNVFATIGVIGSTYRIVLREGGGGGGEGGCNQSIFFQKTSVKHNFCRFMFYCR
jgi:hypothetical protein